MTTIPAAQYLRVSTERQEYSGVFGKTDSPPSLALCQPPARKESLVPAQASYGDQQVLNAGSLF